MADARSENTVDRPSFLAGLGRRWRWIAAGTLAGLLACAVFLIAVPPRYAGVATALLDPPPGVDSGGGAAPVDGADAGALILSTDIAGAAIARLSLDANPEFRGEAASDAGVVDAFLSRLTIARSQRSRTVAITFVSRDPELAARGANTVAELAMQSVNEARARAARAQQARLAEKIADAEGRAAEADAKVEAFRAQSASQPEGGPAAGADMSADLNAKLSGARAAEAAASGKADMLRRLERDGRLADAPASVADDALRRLLDQRAALRAEIAEASKTLLPLHPRMKDLASQLAGLDAAVRDSADRTARADEAEARQAGAEADRLEATLAERAKAAAAPAAAASLQSLEAKAKAAHDDLASYQQMAREARAAAEADGARILARAEPPKAPIFPKAGPTLLAGGSAGLILSALAAAGAALVVRGRKSSLPSAPVEPETLKVAPPPTVAELDSAQAPAPPLRAAPPPGALDAAAGLVETLRRMKAKDNLVVLVAGDRTGQALAIALEAARSFAAERDAVFVDLGETQDWLADILYREAPDEPAVVGLSDLIAGRAGYGAVIQRDLSSSLDVVLPGASGGGGRVEEALTAFAAAYPAVVLHASNWRVAWARAAAAFADLVVIVAPAARVEAAREAAEAALGDACPTFLPFAVRAAARTAEPVG